MDCYEPYWIWPAPWGQDTLGNILKVMQQGVCARICVSGHLFLDFSSLHQGSLTKERNRHRNPQEPLNCKLPRSGDSGALPRSLGPIHPSSSCWEHGLLTAHGCSPRCAFFPGHRAHSFHPRLWPLLGSNSWASDTDARIQRSGSIVSIWDNSWRSHLSFRTPRRFSWGFSWVTTMWVSFSSSPLCLPHLLMCLPKSALQKTCKPLPP